MFSKILGTLALCSALVAAGQVLAASTASTAPGDGTAASTTKKVRHHHARAHKTVKPATAAPADK